jgi:hypothetical protein
MNKHYYGTTNSTQCAEIVEDVVRVLGGGANARRLLLETAAQETHLGTYQDPTPYKAGTGVCQFDEIAFNGVVNRTRKRHRRAIREAFGVELHLVKYRELEFSPLLSFIFCRLKYKLIPEAIPETLSGRADYWKKHYNTAAGKGTANEYILNAERYL